MKVAYFLRSLDLLFSHQNSCKIYPICLEGSEEMRIAKEELLLPNIIPIRLKKGVNFSELRPEAVVKNSNLTQQLKNHKIGCLFLRNATAYLEGWSRANKIALLSPPHELAERFENKLYFDKFLKRTGAPTARSAVLRSRNSLLPFRKTVVQVPRSTGGEGTFFADSTASLRKILKNLKMPVLAREYQPGLPLGVSFFVDQKNLYLSALNRQCFLKDPKATPLGLFLGVQWLPARIFKKAVYDKIAEALMKMAQRINRNGLSGMFNLDFILSKKNEVFFLECNPRITAATPQIIAQKELNGGADFLRLLLNHFCHKNYPVAKPGLLPKNSFEGSQMTVEWPSQKIKKITPGGFFVLRNGGIKKIKLGNRFDFMKLKNGLFFYNETNQGENYRKTITAGTIFANFPMYDIKTGHLNKNGEIVYDFFR